MPSKPSKGLIVIDYLKMYPAASSAKIAQILYSEFPAEFTSVENARDMVRYYRGARGNQHRERMDDDNYLPKFIAPPSDSREQSSYVIPDDAAPIVAFGDVHFPYHSPDALEITIEHAISIGAKTILMMGDIVDCYQVSRWERDPSMRDVKGEIEMFIDFIKSLKAAMPGVKIIYKFGNHEHRFDRYIMANAPELFNIDSIRLQNLLKLDELGIDYVSPMRIIKYKQLHLIHGHEYVFSINNPVNAARGLYLKAKKSAVTWHHHRSSEHTESAINGDMVTCWSSGCLCDLKPEYMPLNSWNHGFVEIHDQDGMFQVNNRRIISYRVM